MTDRLTLVLSKLDKVSGAKHRFKALCPTHDDGTPSLIITEGDDGRVLFHCFRGCTIDSILTAMGISIPDLFPPNGSRSKADEAKGREIAPIDRERAQLALQRIKKAKALV